MGFNIATQLLGCKVGHEANVAIDALAPVAANAVPGGAAITAAVEAVGGAIAATSPKTATSSPVQPVLPGLGIPQPTGMARAAERVLLALDPGLLTLIDEAILHYAGPKVAADIEQVVNGYFEVVGFSAPKV